jgi:hypothetical protein
VTTPNDPAGEMGQVPIRHLPLSDLRPSPENDQLYKPVSPSDPDVQDLAAGIRRDGLLEPLVVTLDNYILSGHRRRVACKLAGLTEVPCRVENILNRSIQNTASFIDRTLIQHYGCGQYRDGWFNTHLVQRFGKSRKAMGVFELKQVRDYAERFRKRVVARQEVPEE